MQTHTFDLVTTDNRNIDIIPHGTGDVNLSTDTVKIGASGEDVIVTTNGTGDITLSTNSGTNSGSIVIADGANNDITLTPNGSGDVIIDGLKYPQADGSADQVLKTDGSGTVNFGAIPATGSNTQVQFNDGGSLAGDSDFTFDKSLACLFEFFTIYLLTFFFFKITNQSFCDKGYLDLINALAYKISPSLSV